jgi:hypothetical protein
VTEVYPLAANVLTEEKRTAGHRAGPDRLLTAAHSASHADSAGNCGYLFQGLHPRATAGRLGTRSGKTDHRGVHRPGI